MGRGTLSASYVLASSMVPKPRNQCIDHGTDFAGGWVGLTKFSTAILWPIAKATEFVLAQVSRWYAHICLTCRVTICSQAWLQLPGARIFGPAPRSYNHAIACVLKHP